MTEPTDERELLHRAVSGDEAALTILLGRYDPQLRPRVASDLPRKWQSLLSVDDVLQQAYTDAFMAIERFTPQGEGSFRAWLFRLARNAMLDAIYELEAAKRGGGRARLEPDTNRSLTSLLDLVGVYSTTPSRVIAAQEQLEALRRIISQLPEDYRKVVELYDLQQLPIEEVAAVLGRSVGATYMLRNRAHRMIALALSGSSGATRS